MKTLHEFLSALIIACVLLALLAWATAKKL